MSPLSRSKCQRSRSTRRFGWLFKSLHNLYVRHHILRYHPERAAACRPWGRGIVWRRTSGSCPRFILASDCVQPPVPTLWILPHAGLHLATEHSRSQELECRMRYRPVSPPHHLCPHSGDSWRHFSSSHNGVNNTIHCVVVLKCLALSTTLILANWTELNLLVYFWVFHMQLLNGCISL